MRRALITGVTGQDGWYLSQLLLEQGAEVFGLVAAADAAVVPPQVRPLPGDLRDAASLRAALRASRPTELYNLAAVSSVADSWADPESAAEVNGTGVMRLLSAVRELAPDVRFVQAGSAEIFGAAPAPHREDTPIAPSSPYGAAKAFAQHAVTVYRAAGLAASNAILYNHESPRRPEHFVTRKITAAVARIATGSSEQLTLGDVEVRRDWGFAGDYMQALVLLAQLPQPADVIVATGQTHSVREFLALAFAHVGITDWQPHVRFDPDLVRPVETPLRYGDPTRARELLGWQPRHSFAELVAMMVDADLALLTRD